MSYEPKTSRPADRLPHTDTIPDLNDTVRTRPRVKRTMTINDAPFAPQAGKESGAKQPGDGKPEVRPEWRFGKIVFFAIVSSALLWTTWLSALLVAASYPLYRYVLTHLRGRVALSAFLMVLSLLALVLIPSIVGGSVAVRQAGELAADLQSSNAQRVVPASVVVTTLRALPGWIARKGPALVGSRTVILIELVCVSIFALFFYIEGEAILSKLATLSPLPPHYAREFGGRLNEVIDATFRGQLVAAIAQGTATAIGLAIAGVPLSALWGFAAIALSLVPTIGAPLVWVPAAIYLGISASAGERTYFGAIFLLVWGFLIVHPMDKIVRTWAMRGKAHVPEILVMLSLAGGLWMFGFLGILVGPLILALVIPTIGVYQHLARSVSEGPATNSGPNNPRVPTPKSSPPVRPDIRQ